MTKTSTSASSPAAQTGSAGERPTSYKLDHLRELEAEVIYVIREVAVITWVGWRQPPW